ncbi:MAG: hypothetical protein RQ867_07215 [Mariprofundaceae bacterium]|nr:hypothetical protein [Mariprofundaceae bacterium]
MNTLGRYLGQAMAYLMFIAFVGYFSTSPSYVHVPADMALIKFTFSHAGKRVKEFDDTRSKEEMANLPPQLRKKKLSRERASLEVEFEMDGQMLFDKTIAPRGLARDLPSPIYERFLVPAGTHHFKVRMRDSIHVEGFNYFGEKTMTLKPLQTMIVDFDDIRNEFVIH